MSNGIGLLFTLTSGLTVALILGYIAQKIKLSPLVGYLLAGIMVSPHSPGIVADMSIAQQCAEIGIVLLMFGVGMHFKLEDFISVKNIAVGALIQIATCTTVTTILIKFLGWSWTSAIILGLSISVASTVVLTRVFSDNKLLHTPTGHAAIGWLIMEDLFTIVVLVLLPAFFGKTASNHNLFLTFIITIAKLAVLVVFALIVGKKVIPFLLEHIAKTGNRELFILSVLVIALGISVCAAEFFGASMALGAFLAGMVVGQSDFSARATSEALPISDVFSVLFFVSVGMLFDISTLKSSWPLIIILLFVVLFVKPIGATLIIKFLKQPVKKAIAIGTALGQIGEFSFILASLAVSYGIMSKDAYNAIIFVSIITITFNTTIYRWIPSIIKFLQKKGYFKTYYTITDEIENETKDLRHVIVIGYGPVGRTISKILLQKEINVTVIEMNIDTVKKIKSQNIKELRAIYGDASQREILIMSAIQTAEAIVISTPFAPAQEITEIAKSLNSRIKILVHTTYSENAKELRKKNSDMIVRSGEGSVALALSREVFSIYGTTNFEEEIDKIYKELL
ncbi:cation:proton antiporter [Candidatus Ruminimicrobiellum ovillum]|uniref:cation:proton antiporter n=1 Tax=Candidatus Ruminimicrobiellum ovillum TaxID=1947927 RepID=UPI0035598472